MAAINCKIFHEGFWRVKTGTVENENNGIYFLYENSYDSCSGTIKLEKLLFIEDSFSFKNKEKEIVDLCKNKINPQNEISYSFARVTEKYKYRILSAYISHHKPILNNHSHCFFGFDKTILVSHGSIGLIDQVIETDL